MKTLIITDVQHDFMPGGALGISGGNAIVPIINRLIPKFDHVFATQDWHSPHHISFASTHKKKPGEVIDVAGHQQTLWPDHCVQNTRGADFVEGLHRDRIEAVFHKGTDPKIDSYSTFFDNARQKHTGLAKHLQKHNLKDLYFVGLATDYCILYSVLDALELGFNAWVIRDACRAIHNEKASLEKMREKGARIILSEDILGSSQLS